jgi:hypothetical protein
MSRLLETFAARMLAVLHASAVVTVGLAAGGCGSDGECCGNLDQSCCEPGPSADRQEQRCLDWAADAGACPAGGDARDQLNETTTGTAVVSSVDSEGTLADGQCCYEVTVHYQSGRPFVVEDRPRVATMGPSTRASSDWSAGGARPDTADLSPAERAALAAAFTRDGLAEHASVASFARAALELMAMGAPAELVALTHAAALDEIRHAQLCFALASSYAGKPVRPGPFPLGPQVDLAKDMRSLAIAVAVEGCVNETLAAIVVAEQHQRATDPAVRAALGTIAADEARHAELAWRTLAWALREGGDSVASAAREVFTRAMASTPRPEDNPEIEGAPSSHGRIGAVEIAELQRRGLREVVSPCVASLHLGAGRLQEHP